MVIGVVMLLVLAVLRINALVGQLRLIDPRLRTAER